MWLQPTKVMEHAAVVTYGSSASTVMFWGFHFSDIAMGVSATAAVIGVGLQVYVAIEKVRLMRRSQRWTMEHRHDGQRKNSPD